ncbi:hypothetical protein [Halobellus litoreus]|uniref:PGF-CTERM protein n=1 Tax=Halobellus litoreus TaxID=755310 RepID=A0ABD6E016_9EURY|nr:hypothetical protein [Halobellus litoreus]
MTEFTFFEIHLHDGLSFSATNTAPAIGGSGDEAASSEADGEESSDGSGGTEETGTPLGEDSGRLRIGALVALVLLVALAAAAKYLRGDDDLELTELDDFAEE